MNSVLFEPVSRLARRIRDREVSAVEVVEAHLARLDEVDPVINAVVTRCDEAALKRAREADTALSRGEKLGPLHGVPITIKDAFDTAGVRTTGGTKGRADYVPPENATVVARLLAAGAILIGKTNTPELTLLYDTDNLLFGATRNPRDPALSPGGSSGGSAAIVAAGGSALDIGSDTGGSIRLPAHFCGVAGIKPTAGRVPRTGLIIPGGTPADALTQVGPIARYIDDLSLVMPIISGPDESDCSAVPMELGDPASVDMAGLHVVFYTDNGDVTVSGDVSETVRLCARLLSEQGCEITENPPPDIALTRGLFGRIFGTDGGAWVRRLLEAVGTRERYPGLRWANEKTDTPELPASAYTLLLHELDEWRRGMLAYFQNYDVILAPVHTSAALPHGELINESARAAFSYTQTYNLTGWPSVAVPAGACARGLPIGVQVVAHPGREHVALAVAKRIETAFGGWQGTDLLLRKQK